MAPSPKSAPSRRAVNRFSGDCIADMSIDGILRELGGDNGTLCAARTDARQSRSSSLLDRTARRKNAHRIPGST